MMGLDKTELLAQYSKIKEAETENNRQQRINDGTLCKKCEKAFLPDEPRIREGAASNIPAWHGNCYLESL